MEVIDIVFDVSALKQVQEKIREESCNIYDLMISIVERIAN